MWRIGFGAVYFIGFEGDPDDAPIKVGTALEPVRRLNNIQTGNWRQIRLKELLLIRGVSHFTAERAIHAVLDSRGLRVRGEWFAGGSDRVIETARQALRDYGGIEVISLASFRRRVASIKEEANLLVRPPRTVKGRKPVKYRADPMKVDLAISNAFRLQTERFKQEQSEPAA